jgi:hypothetical protein
VFEVEGDRRRVPAIVDVGGDDHLMVAGCHRAERAEGRSFRWTGRGARVRVGPARQVRFVWSPGSHPTRPLPVSVRVDGKRVGFARLERGWHVSRWFSLPDTHDRMIIEIRTETFQPFALGRGSDRRLLGLRLDAVEVR